MPQSPAVRRVRFSRYIDRVLEGARARGLTDRDVERLTGIRASTVHRWRRGEVLPQIETVERFCEGLDLPTDDALQALGYGAAGRRETTAPEPQLDPDLKIVARRLADPSVSQAEKDVIRATLQYLAHLADRQPPRKRNPGSKRTA